MPADGAFRPEYITPARNLVSVTASDTTEYDPPLKGVYVGTTGNLAVLAVGDSAAVTITNLPVGVVFPVLAKKVMSTNTTASGIVGLR